MLINKRKELYHGFMNPIFCRLGALNIRYNMQRSDLLPLDRVSLICALLLIYLFIQLFIKHKNEQQLEEKTDISIGRAN